MAVGHALGVARRACRVAQHRRLILLHLDQFSRRLRRRDQIDIAVEGDALHVERA